MWDDDDDWYESLTEVLKARFRPELVEQLAHPGSAFFEKLLRERPEKILESPTPFFPQMTKEEARCR